DICEKSIQLNWTHYEGWVGSEEIDRYEIITKIGNSNFEVITQLNPNITTYKHENLIYDVNYCYYIRAVSSSGVFSYSNENCRLVEKPAQADFHYLSTASHLITNGILVE